MNLTTKNNVIVYGIKDVQVDEFEMLVACGLYDLSPDQMTPMLAYGQRNMVGQEIRHYYFDLAREESGRLNPEPVLRSLPATEGNLLKYLPVTRIFSFGQCNVACPYCKRDVQFIDDQGRPIVAVDVELRHLFAMAHRAAERGEIVRFSGGDPVMFQKHCLALTYYVRSVFGAKTSIAHNGTGTRWVRQMLPLMDSAAIDLKAVPERMGEIMGVGQKAGERMYHQSLATQALFSNPETNPHGAILDVRTPVFGDTTLKDMLRLANDICQGDPTTVFWTWRLYKEVKGCTWQVPDKDIVTGMLAEVSRRYPRHWMGIRAKWNGGGMLYFRGGQVVNPTTKFDTSEVAGSGNFDTAQEEGGWHA